MSIVDAAGDPCSTDDTGSTGSEPDYGVPQTTGTGTT
jgi:hypothetical protein